MSIVCRLASMAFHSGLLMVMVVASCMDKDAAMTPHVSPEAIARYSIELFELGGTIRYVECFPPEWQAEFSKGPQDGYEALKAVDNERLRLLRLLAKTKVTEEMVGRIQSRFTPETSNSPFGQVVGPDGKIRWERIKFNNDGNVATAVVNEEVVQGYVTVDGKWYVVPYRVNEADFTYDSEKCKNHAILSMLGFVQLSQKITELNQRIENGADTDRAVDLVMSELFRDWKSTGAYDGTRPDTPVTPGEE